MKSAEVVIQNKLGLHARAAAKLVQLSNQYTARVTLEKDGEHADGKSIMDVLMLAGVQGSRLSIQVEGQDEEDALSDLLQLINNKFGEGE